MRRYLFVLSPVFCFALAIGLTLGFTAATFVSSAVAGGGPDFICDENLPCADCTPCDDKIYPPGMIICGHYAGTWYDTRNHVYSGCCAYLYTDECHYPD